jgi:predicted nucleic acid-binding protein
MSLIAADTSSLVAFLSGEAGSDVEAIDRAMASKALALPPPVVTELLSKPDSAQIVYLLQTTRLLPIEEGLWRRAGETRRTLLRNGLKAALADALIAQFCIDADAPLITRDADYRHFAKHCGLRLA